MSTTAPPAEQVTIRLTDEQARHVRQTLLYDLPGEGLDDVETREEIVDYLAGASQVLDRLDRLGWKDTDGQRAYTSDVERLTEMAARLIAWGADQNFNRDESFSEEAARRRQQVAPALTGVAILEQLDAQGATTDTEADDAR